MAKWPDNPVYTPLSEINKGNEYEPADGIVAKDINAFIENVDYLNKAIIDLKKDLVVVVQATGQSTTDVIISYLYRWSNLSLNYNYIYKWIL